MLVVLLINYLVLLPSFLEFILCLEADRLIRRKMAQGRCSAMLSVVLLLVSAAAVVQGAVYTVGGTNGWRVPDGTSLSKTYLADWAAAQTFVAGDTVVFTYNRAGHNVLTVSSTDYAGCVSSAPSNRVQTGNDSILLVAGENYYICGIPGHCAGGQKVQITATAAPGATPGTPGTPSPPAAPGTPAPGTGAAAGNTVTVFQVLAAVTVSVVASLALW